MTSAVLHDGLRQLGFADDDARFSGIAVRPLSQLEPLLERYIALLQTYTAKFDLIKANTRDDIIVRHILDSLAAVPAIATLIAMRHGMTDTANSDKSDGIQIATADHTTTAKEQHRNANAATADHAAVIGSAITTNDAIPIMLADSTCATDIDRAAAVTIADIGSGAGLPGIPLAAAFSGVSFVLVERMSKRCGFLRICVRELGLSNVTVEEEQAERLAQNRFDIAVFRAFHPLEKKLLRVLRRILKSNGVLAAYKARRDSIAAELATLGDAAGAYCIQSLTVPFLADHERNLVIIKK